MERSTVRDTEPTPQAQAAEDYSVGTADDKGREEPASAVPAQHGPGPPASSTLAAQLEPVASAAAAGTGPEAEQQIDLLKAELAAVKQSLATYESTLQQLLGGPHLPSAFQQLQGTSAVAEVVQHDMAGRSSSAAATRQQQMEQQSVGQDTSEQAIEQQAAALVLGPIQQQAGIAAVERLLASGVPLAELEQLDPSAEPAHAAGTQRSLATTIVAPDPESRLQASASAPSFSEQAAPGSSAQQPILHLPGVQRRSTFGTAGSVPGSEFDLLQHSSPGSLGTVRPPSSLQLAPPTAGFLQDISFTRQQQPQQYLDTTSSQVQQAGPSGPVSIPVGMRSSSPSLAAGFATSPSVASSILMGQVQAAQGGLLPPLPGRQGRQSDSASAAAVAGRVISPPGSGNLALSPPVSDSLATTSLGMLNIAPAVSQQLPGPSLVHLGGVQADTAGSLSLSPEALGLGSAAAEAAARVTSVPSYEVPDVMPGSSASGADQFTNQQLQALLQQGQLQQGQGQEVTAAEQLAMLQQFYQQQQQGLTADVQQQRLLAAMSQLSMKDPGVASMMAASAMAATPAGQTAGALGAGVPLGAGWDQTAAALAAAGGLDSAGQAALQQEALQAQALAQLQAQAELQAYQQVQLAQQLQQQQYNPYLQQLLAAQAASLWQQPGQAGLWPSGFAGAASSSNTRLGSRGGDVQPSGARDVRKGAERATRGAAAAGPSAAGSSRQPRTSDEPDWRRIFVGNIGWWVDEQMLQRIFGEYGTILDAQVMWNTKLLAKGKRVNREFAFISFATPEEAGNAIRWLNGRYIEGITKDRDGLTVQYEAQGVGKSPSQGHQPPLHLQQIINPGLAGQQQQQQQFILQQLQQQQQQQQQGVLELLTKQQQLGQQQPWPAGSDLALLQQLGLAQQQLGQQQQAAAGLLLDAGSTAAPGLQQPGQGRTGAVKAHMASASQTLPGCMLCTVGQQLTAAMWSRGE